MERWVKRAIELGAGIMYFTKDNPSVIPYHPQKTEVSGKEKQYFHRTYPEKVGITSGRILAMLSALEREKRANIHNLLVIKDGYVICECSHPGFSVNTWHLSHSMSKTLTGMAIGMLVDDGKLKTEDRLVDILPELEYEDPKFSKITLGHLLSMSAGVRFSEAGAVTEQRWTEAFFSSSLAYNPGAGFNYNSMNSYVLAVIVTRIAGMSLEELLRQRLFEPLGITNYLMEKSPEGIEKGGWGVYMSAESWAKVGSMMLSGGIFEGRRILSEEWVKKSTGGYSVETPKNLGRYNYGYQLWVARDGDDFLFNGMLGQNVWVCPKNNLIVVLNSGNNELFQNSPALSIIDKYLDLDLSDDLHNSFFAGDLVDLRYREEHFFEGRHWIRPYEGKRGIGYRLGFRHREPYPPEWEELIGKYHFRKNNYGIIPLFVRGMQNNLHSSVDGVSFEREGERMYFVFTEGGVSYKLEIGFYDFKTTVLEYRGEKYLVSVMGEAMEDEDRNMLYKLELLFPELPNTRMIKLSFIEGGRLLMRMSEVPNHKIADIFIEDLSKYNPKISFALDLIDKRVGSNYAKRKLEETFAPVLIGARVGAENYTAIMNEEREKQKAAEKTSRLIASVIDRFIKEDDKEASEESKSAIADFIGEVLDKIKVKLPQIGLKTPQQKPCLPDADFEESQSGRDDRQNSEENGKANKESAEKEKKSFLGFKKK